VQPFRQLSEGLLPCWHVRRHASSWHSLHMPSMKSGVVRFWRVEETRVRPLIAYRTLAEVDRWCRKSARTRPE
jgi:hypothetical protein